MMLLTTSSNQPITDAVSDARFHEADEDKGVALIHGWAGDRRIDRIILTSVVAATSVAETTVLVQDAQELNLEKSGCGSGHGRPH